MTNKEMKDSMEKEIRAQGLEIITNVMINKTMTDMKAVYETPEYKSIFDGFVDDHKRTMLKYANDWVDYRAHFCDDGHIYEEFTIRGEGLRVLHQIEGGTCISNSPFNQAIIVDDGYMFIVRRGWAKTPANRKAIATMGFTVCSFI